MKFFYCLILVFLAISCSGNKDENSLILPPNFTEIPDLKNPSQPNQKENEQNSKENVLKLKELLLKSSE